MTEHIPDDLPRLELRDEPDDRPDAQWVGNVVERVAAAVVEVNTALLRQVGRAVRRLVTRPPDQR
ncbi:MAG TPA: hypothetical protein VJT49_13930 [Amycolatopsis sp.]|uniref:hypothetical protein n=1 Tax=Amycolatopsis sp. TaxID=37632 RepID=UPI002B492E9A|nr:hypothetical protein [Amycolatopsis sp.]HKS46182.1 hypothetical protein [Amycolatopsis sp.]